MRFANKLPVAIQAEQMEAIVQKPTEYEWLTEQADASIDGTTSTFAQIQLHSFRECAAKKRELLLQQLPEMNK